MAKEKEQGVEYHFMANEYDNMVIDRLRGDTIRSKVFRFTLRFTYSVYSEALVELAGFFSSDEWKFLAHVLRDKYTPTDVASVTSKTVLCNFITAPGNDPLTMYYGIEKTGLVTRINDSLSVHHVFAIFLRVKEYWENTDRITIEDWAIL